MGSKSIAGALLLSLLTPLPALLAQANNLPATPTTGASAPTPAPAAPGDEEGGRVIVTDVPIEENIMPTSRPTSSVYGTDTSILDTPRNVTIISREQLSAIDI